MSKNTAKAVGAKISGLKLLVIDEISMINLETLAEISSRQIEAMLSQTDDESDRNVISSQLFGGIHVLITCDFYQLKPIQGEAIYTESPKYIKSMAGLKIWHSLNEYFELIENTRFKNDLTNIHDSHEYVFEWSQKRKS